MDNNTLFLHIINMHVVPVHMIFLYLFLFTQKKACTCTSDEQNSLTKINESEIPDNKIKNQKSGKNISATSIASNRQKQDEHLNVSCNYITKECTCNGGGIILSKRCTTYIENWKAILNDAILENITDSKEDCNMCLRKKLVKGFKRHELLHLVHVHRKYKELLNIAEYSDIKNLHAGETSVYKGIFFAKFFCNIYKQLRLQRNARFKDHMVVTRAYVGVVKILGSLKSKVMLATEMKNVHPVKDTNHLMEITSIEYERALLSVEREPESTETIEGSMGGTRDAKEDDLDMVETDDIFVREVRETGMVNCDLLPYVIPPTKSDLKYLSKKRKTKLIQNTRST